LCDTTFQANFDAELMRNVQQQRPGDFGQPLPGISGDHIPAIGNWNPGHDVQPR
jgi:hypothetical protein